MVNDPFVDFPAGCWLLTLGIHATPPTLLFPSGYILASDIVFSSPPQVGGLLTLVKIKSPPNFSQIGRQTDEKMCIRRNFEDNLLQPQLKGRGLLITG